MRQSTLGIVLVGITAVVLGGCAKDSFFGTTEHTQVSQNKFKEANERYNQINNLFAQAEKAIKTGDVDEAHNIYGEVLKLDSANERAQIGLRQLVIMNKHNDVIKEAKFLYDAGNFDAAKLKLRPVLIENPAQLEARALLQEIDAKTAKDLITPLKLKPSRSKNLTLEFRDAGLRNVFEVISKTSGINFVFDPTVKYDLKASIFVKDASVEDVIDFLLLMHQMGKKVLTENSLLIYPLNKAAQYDDMVLRSFYLNHADAKQTMGLIKQMLPIKDVFVDEKLNMITLKATYSQLKDVERLIADEDMPDPEVILDLEVLEVNRSRLTDIGLAFPNSISVLGTPPGVNTSDKRVWTWNDLTHTTGSTILVSPMPAINLLRQDGDTRILANPRIRTKNREKAKIHIGDKIPIETTTTSSASNFASTSANYLDTGLKLDIEPRVMLNNEVSIKLNLEVSNSTLPAGAKFPTISTRTTATVLMGSDGDTQMLAGLIGETDTKNVEKVAGLSDIPILGRLFSNPNISKSKTEIVLLITPHVVRNILQPEAQNVEFYGGTGGRNAPVNFNPNSSLQQMRGGSAFVPVEDRPLVVPASAAPALLPGAAPVTGTSSVAQPAVSPP